VSRLERLAKSGHLHDKEYHYDHPLGGWETFFPSVALVRNLALRDYGVHGEVVCHGR
jgi:hypothetical protein